MTLRHHLGDNPFYDDSLFSLRGDVDKFVLQHLLSVLLWVEVESTMCKYVVLALRRESRNEMWRLTWDMRFVTSVVMMRPYKYMGRYSPKEGKNRRKVTF